VAEGSTADETWTEHVVRQYEDGRTVEEVLTRSLLLAHRDIRRLERSRALRLNRRPTLLRERVRTGDRIAFDLSAEEYSGLDATPMPLDIRYEDADLLVVNKAPYVLVHPTVPEQTHTLVNGLTHYYMQQGRRAKVHPVHRLDRDTSGLVLIARTPEAHRRLGQQLDARTLKREYLAIAHGVLVDDEGLVDAPIGQHPTQKPLRVVHPAGEPARTRYRVVERYREATLVQLELETGRTHQIRVHLAHLGHPLLGDRQYGRRGLNRIRRQALHAVRIACTHPVTGEALRIEAPLPTDMQALCEELRRQMQ
jgi:23S rRNA pseudouridine1911/1915/1917 synthase